MSILDFLKKHITTHSSPTPHQYSLPAVGYNELLKYEILKRLNKVEEKDIYEKCKYWDSDVVKGIYISCIKEGLLCIVSGYDSLFGYTLPVLKEILKSHGLKVSGKKDELIECIRMSVPEKELNIKPLIKRTAAGDAEYNRILLLNEQAFNSCFDNAVNFVRQGRLAEASNTVLAYESTQPFQRDTSSAYVKNIGAYSRTFDVLYQRTENKLSFAFYFVFSEMNLSIFTLQNKIERYSNIYQNNYNLLNLPNDICYYRMKQNLISIELDGHKYFKVLCSKDCCQYCESHGNKKIPINKAVIGVNTPPFHEDCKCFVTAAF